MGADELALDVAALVDDVGFWGTKGAIKRVGLTFFVEDSKQRGGAALEKGLVAGGVLVKGDGDDFDLGKLLLEGFERGHFGDAWGAPASPKVKQDDLAAQGAKVDGVLPVVEGELRRGCAELLRAVVAVAAGEGQEQG